MTLVASWYGGCSAKAMRPLLVPLLAVSLLAGCSAPAADEDAAYSAEAEGALTLADGDRYVVRADAQSGEVVLRTSVDGVPLPYDAPAMLGKALLIHPLPGRADEGIYARVTSATRVQGEGRLDSGDTLRLTTTPLSLEEMAGLSEDDVLRIYLARGLRGGSLEPASLSLLDVGGTPPANTSAKLPCCAEDVSMVMMPMSASSFSMDKARRSFGMTWDGGHLFHPALSGRATLTEGLSIPVDPRARVHLHEVPC